MASDGITTSIFEILTTVFALVDLLVRLGLVPRSPPLAVAPEMAQVSRRPPRSLAAPMHVPPAPPNPAARPCTGTPCVAARVPAHPPCPSRRTVARSAPPARALHAAAFPRTPSRASHL